jgi:hypothetical protein
MQNAPQEEAGALGNTFNARSGGMLSGAAVSYVFNWPVGYADVDASALPSSIPKTQARSA